MEIGSEGRAGIAMIEVRGLHKSFGEHAVLRDVHFEVPQGAFLALVGPNGAGKTTLVRILATLSRATSGDCRVAGLDVQHHGVSVRRRIGLVSHQPLLYMDLTAEENLRFYARCYGFEDVAARVQSLLVRVGLEDRGPDLVRTFSRGMQQRLAIARAILHDPQVLLLDEPDTGLDPSAAERLQEMLEELATEGRTVLMTTHDLNRAVSMATEVAVLARGRLETLGSTSGLSAAALRDRYDRAALGQPSARGRA